MIELPDGIYAEWRGTTYPAGPSTTPSHLVVVPRAEAQVFVLETTCRWRGEPFRVTYAKQPGRFGLTWMGAEPDQAHQKEIWADRPSSPPPTRSRSATA